MSVEVISWALNEAPTMPPSAKLVLIGLANHAHPDGSSAFPSVARLMRYTCLSERTVRAQLALLEEMGVIQRSDQRIVAAYISRPDRRPVGWNIVMSGVRTSQVVAERGADSDRNGVRDLPERGAGVAPETSYNRPDEPPVEDLSEVAQQLADEFADSLVETSPNGFRRPVVQRMWVKAMALMIAEDGRPVGEIRRLTAFAHRHPYWGRHIQTPMAMRSKYDAVLRESALTPAETADEAWQTVISEIRRVGRGGTPELNNPVSQRIVDEIGWNTLCMGEEHGMNRLFLGKYRQYGKRVVA